MLSKLTPITNAISSHVHDLTGPELTLEDLRTLAVCTAFFVLFALEARCAYGKHEPASVRQSYSTNLSSFIVNDALISGLAIFSLWHVTKHRADHGLLGSVSNPLTKALGSLLLLDLALHFRHRINHQIDALWGLHKVHHSDHCMNVTTAFRLHGGEIVLTNPVKVAFIVLAGIDTRSCS